MIYFFVRMTEVFVICLPITLSIACGSSSGNNGPILNSNKAASENTVSIPPIENNLDVSADIKILFLGNSHTASGRIPATVQRILNSRQSEKKVACRYIGGMFLDSFASNRQAMQLIKNGGWDVVVLQGQKISMSGKYIYSTEAAEKLAELASESGAKVIMFCEWGRFRAPGDNDPGKIGETARIQKIYQGICDKTGATLVPVGLAWEKALKENSKWHFHARDGNHSNETGAFFSSLVLQEVIIDVLNAGHEIEIDEFKPLKKYPASIDDQKAMMKLAIEVLDSHQRLSSNNR